MKQLLIIAFMVNSVTLLIAQPGDYNEQINSRKKEYITQRLQLDEKTSNEFFAIYDEYQAKRKNLRIDISQNQLTFRKSDLSDAEAKKALDSEFDLKMKLISLEKDYTSKYLKVLTPQQVIEVYKSEDDFNRRMMDRVRENARKGGHGPNQEMPERPERPERPNRPNQPNHPNR